MGLFNDLINAVQKPVQSSGTWKNGKFIKEPAHPALSNSFGFVVAGVEYKTENISHLASPMKKWDMTNEQILKKYPGKKIFRYYYISEPVQLVPEPTNPHDSNAIKVMINNIHVGYVPATACNIVKQYMTSGPYTLSAKITGGEYKLIYSDGHSDNFSEPLSIEIFITK